jgi:ABC-2 type transport system permease protein
MTSLVRGELIKTVTTRTLLGYAATGVAITVANLLVEALSGDLVAVSDKRSAVATLPILLLLFGVVGAAGEYRHRTAAPSALAAGRARGSLLVARAAAYAVAGAAVGALMVAVALAIGLPLLAGEPGPGLSGGDVLVVAGGGLLAAAWSAIIGVAGGALVRNQIAGVIGVLILAFVVTPLVATIDDSAAGYTPFGAAVVLAGNADGGTVSWAGAALVLAAWTVPLLVAAVITERRRDLA